MATRQSKSSNTFPHDSNARCDEKLVRLRMRHGAAGYGVYFMLLERLRDDADFMSVKDYNMIAFDLRVDAAIVKSVVEEFGLFTFTENGKCFYSESLNRRMDIKQAIRRRCSEAGKSGMEKRWSKNEAAVVADKMDVPAPSATSIPATPATPSLADNNACFNRFFSKNNSAKLEVLLMNLGLKPNDVALLRDVAKEVVAEWELSNKEHSDFTDWSQHLIATMRIKVKDKGLNAKADALPPKADDYLYNGGFGSKDI